MSMVRDLIREQDPAIRDRKLAQIILYRLALNFRHQREKLVIDRLVVGAENVPERRPAPFDEREYAKIKALMALIGFAPGPITEALVQNIKDMTATQPLDNWSALLLRIADEMDLEYKDTF